MYIFDPVFIKWNPFTLQDIFCAKHQTQTELLSPCEIEGFCQKCSVFFFFSTDRGIFNIVFLDFLKKVFFRKHKSFLFAHNNRIISGKKTRLSGSILLDPLKNGPL